MFRDFLDIVALRFAQFLCFLLRRLPDALAFTLSRTVIGAVLLVIPRLRGVGRKNLTIIFPEKSADEHRRILDRSLDMLAYNLLGFARAALVTPETAKMMDYTEHAKMLAQARENSSTGALIVSGHYGVFELAVQMHALNDRPLAVLARGFGLPKLDQWMQNQRERFGHVQFGRKGAYREIMRFLSSGKDVLLLFDQNVKANHAVFVDFFGLPAATTRTVALAAIRTGSPIIFAVPVGNGLDELAWDARYIGRASDFSGSLEEKSSSITRRLHEELERAVREHPEHWLWLHRRFKTRPPGDPENMYRKNPSFNQKLGLSF